MESAKIKNAIGKLEPDEEMKYRLAEKLNKQNHRKHSAKPIAAIAAGLAVVLCAGLLAANFIGSKPGGNPGDIAQGSGVYIPKVELSENPNTSAKMMGLIVYQGRIYLQSALQLEPGTAEKFLDEKIGKTKGNITEWSKQEDYAEELASTIGMQDVYTVKGYDKSFRLMAVEKIDGVAYGQFYECLNGLTVKTGADIFGKLKMEGNAEAAKYELFESWNNGKQEVRPLAKLDGLNGFLTALNKSVPYEGDSLPGLWEDQSADSQKFVYITLNDGTEVQLRIFKDGYVYYNNINIFFKVDSTAFASFWNELV